jgi:hypothetical protein
MFVCPHCNKRGISFREKLLGSMLYPAVCRYCRKQSVRHRIVFYTQIFIVVSFFAIVPNVATPPTVKALGAVAAFLIILVKVIGPLRTWN